KVVDSLVTAHVIRATPGCKWAFSAHREPADRISRPSAVSGFIVHRFLGPERACGPTLLLGSFCPCPNYAPGTSFRHHHGEQTASTIRAGAAVSCTDSGFRVRGSVRETREDARRHFVDGVRTGDSRLARLASQLEGWLYRGGWPVRLVRAAGVRPVVRTVHHMVGLNGRSGGARPRPLRVAYASDFHAGPTTDAAVL